MENVKERLSAGGNHYQPHEDPRDLVRVPPTNGARKSADQNSNRGEGVRAMMPRVGVEGGTANLARDIEFRSGRARRDDFDPISALPGESPLKPLDRSPSRNRSESHRQREQLNQQEGHLQASQQLGEG